MPFPTAKDIEFLCRCAIGVTKLARFRKWCKCQHSLPELFICRHFTIIKIYLKFLQFFLVQSGNHFCETPSAYVGRHNLTQHILKTNCNIPLLHVGLLVCEVVMSTVSYRKGLGATSNVFYILLVWILNKLSSIIRIFQMEVLDECLLYQTCLISFLFFWAPFLCWQFSLTRVRREM